MENYQKGEIMEVEDTPPFDLDENAVEMRVNAGSKIRNIMGFAMKKMKEPELKQITWNGSGHAVNKTISCAEIMKRKIKGLHQITRIRFRRIEEYWEPKVEGLERLKVNRDIPAISILLSKDALDAADPGYQAPGSHDHAWLDRPKEERPSSKRLPRSGGGHQGGEGQKRKRKGKKENRDNKTARNSDVAMETDSSTRGATPS